MLTFILIDLRYEQNVVFNFEKGSNSQNHFRFPQHNKKVSQAKFSIALAGGIPLNAISNILNCPFAPKKDFRGKLANAINTFIYLLFPIMLKCFKTP